MLWSLLMLVGTPIPADSTELWSRLAAVCPAPTDRKALTTAERAVNDSLAQRETRERLNTAGCIRMEMAHQKIGLRKDPSPIGMRTYYSWFDGGVSALLRAIDTEDPAPGIVRVVLATEVMNTFSPTPNWLMADSVATLLHRWVKLGKATADLQAACPRLLLAVSDTAMARDCIAVAGGNPAQLPEVRQLRPNIFMGTRLHRLWDPQTMAPRILATFAYEFTDGNKVARAVEETPPPSESPLDAYCGKAGYPTCSIKRQFSASTKSRFRLMVTWWDPLTREGKRFVEDSVSDPPSPGASTLISVTGSHVLEASQLATSWSVAARHEREGVGVRIGIDSLPTLSHDALFLSDVVVGSRENRPVVIKEDSIWIAPWGAISRTRPMEIFFQVGSDIPLPGAVTHLTIRPEDKKDAAVDVTFPTAVRAGITAVAKQLIISTLDEGRYRLTIEVTDQATGRKVSQTRVTYITRNWTSHGVHPM